MQTVSRYIPLSSERGVPIQSGNVWTEGGSRAFRFTVTDLVLTLTSDGNGKVLPVVGGANSLRIGPAMFNAMAALKLLYDRVRLVGLTFHYVPIASVTQAGTLVQFIDYRSDTTVDTLAKAVRTQGAVEFSPWQKGASLIWRAQGPLDYEYVASAAASTTGFNSVVPASFQVYGEALPSTTVVGYIHASAILEFTGRQTV